MVHPQKVRVNKGGAQRFLTAHFRAEEAELRTSTIRGNEYIITPGILLVQGVIQGAKAEAPELALTEEFGKIPKAWDGRPVVINHPQMDGDYVPAGHPDVWETYTVGWLFNTDITDEGKLRSELWLNKEWLQSNTDYSDVLARVQNNEVIEVSTGLFCDLEEVEGIYQGEKYHAIWRNVVPDHLAILPNVKGACSVEDGCGTSRTNQEAAQPKDTEKKGCCMSDNQQPGVLARLVNFVSSMRHNLAGLSTNDLHAALGAALSKVSSYSTYIVAAYDDRVIYETYQEGRGWLILQRSYTMDGTTVNFTGEPVEVRPVTDFIPVAVTQDGGEPTTRTNEEPTAIALEATTSDSLEDAPTAASTVEMAAAPTEVSVPTTTDAPTATQQSQEVSEEVQEALAIRASMRANLIAYISQNSQGQFEQTELEALPYKTLQKFHDSLLGAKQISAPTVVVQSQQTQQPATDYTGMASPQIRASAETATTAPMPVFPRTK